jgi:hypothetical protein
MSNVSKEIKALDLSQIDKERWIKHGVIATVPKDEEKEEDEEESVEDSRFGVVSPAKKGDKDVMNWKPKPWKKVKEPKEPEPTGQNLGDLLRQAGLK